MDSKCPSKIHLHNRIWNSIVNPFQLKCEGSSLCVDSVCYALDKFIKFNMFILDMNYEEWVQIPLPCNPCETSFRKLIEWGGWVHLVLVSGARDMEIWRLGRKVDRKWEN
ncbi:hypothetical protein AMTR_s00165p00066480 [Amborella trichopoda]|uniref:F-box associated domain-containing protein n=1 Tax=Amborella trichopoda TaxID=13333 RepID=W1PW12_AMBTC|nr:hypothetical protein AMTR_s00165p00066480 [Amborella trichopoda]